MYIRSYSNLRVCSPVEAGEVACVARRRGATLPKVAATRKGSRKDNCVKSSMSEAAAVYFFKRRPRGGINIPPLDTMEK